MAIPQGFEDQQNGVYKASTVVTNDKGNKQTIIFKVNNKNGNIDLYDKDPITGGEKLFHRFNSTTNKWEIPKNNVQDGTDAYISVIGSIGEPGSPKFDSILKTAKEGADKVIIGTSSDEDKLNIFSRDAYKSLGNRAPSTGLYSQIEVGESTKLSPSTSLELSDIQSILGPGPIVYPTELRGNGQDFIKFTMMEYGSRPFQSPPLNSNTTSFKIGTRDLKSTGTSVYLPIQPSINDQNDIGWGEEKMTVFQSVLANIATKGSAEVLGSELDKVGEIFGNGEYEKIMRRFLGGMAVGINPIARTDGLVLNPNLELLFSGPSLRPFNFTFRLSPRSDKEAITVKKIIKFFKIGSTVRTTNDGLFLKAPYVFDIAYKYKGADTIIDKDKKEIEQYHPGLNRIKTCALRTVSVNYTPDGSYMTFEDGTMTSYEISLQFCELEPVYDTDQKSASGHPIGF